MKIHNKMRICWFPGVLVLMVNFALVDVAINPAPARDKCLSYESKYVTEHRACDCVVYQSYGLSRGNFHSPNYPQVYDRGIECILFTFIGDVDERVELTFVEFDLKWKDPGAERCGDYLHLFLNLERGEVNENSDYDIELCGNISTLNQKTYYSRGRSLVLEFHSDPTKSLNHTGFKGIFKFLDARDFVSSCQKEQGTMCSYTCPSSPGNNIGNNKFFSPRFPQNYPHTATCHYQFLGQEGEKVRLHFQTIQLYNNENLPCDQAADYIEVHDGLDRTRPTIRQYCGTGGSESRVVTSKGPYMFVIFSSDDVNHQKGFVASYDFISKHSTTIYTPSTFPAYISEDDTFVNCNQNISSLVSHTGTIKSSNFPNRYPSTTRCRYIFTGSAKERVQIRFTDMNLFYSGGNKDDPVDCDQKDSITVYDILDNVETVIDVFCGAKLPPQLMSSGPYLKIEFNSISHIDHVPFSGFSFLYNFRSDFGINTGIQKKNKDCYFEYKSGLTKTGRFVSPNHPGLYPKDTTCHYIFHGEPNEQVHILFREFEVKGKFPRCLSVGSDVVTFSNFYGVEDRDMPRLCGVLKPESKLIVSDSDFLSVVFQSNLIQESSGFEAHYSFKEKNKSTPSNTPQRSRAGVMRSSSLAIIGQLLITVVIAKHLLTVDS
ncbi:suppressor of lurcher protein 1-like [Mizuhopecten yessoensis]|uniref:suppressor of lurcher protein 1-like n=1 Tax=Mizuhopecten yessoensis TaxID=6573 RepID=UPI000B45B799|nr:suppressor of lurcher protein 1-like [Mizuhopecten yessoensis]